MIYRKKNLTSTSQAIPSDSKHQSNERQIALRKKSRSLQQNLKRPSQTESGRMKSKLKYDLSILPYELCPIYPSLFSISSSFKDYFTTFQSCSDPEHLILLLKGLNLLLSNSMPNISELIEQKVHLKLLQIIESPHMTKECLDCFINITSFYESLEFINSGLVETLLELLSASKEISNLAIWVLGNLAGESFESRSLCLEKGVLNKVLPFVHVSECCENATWVVSNFCKGKSQLDDQVFIWIVREMMKVIQEKNLECKACALEVIYFCTLKRENVLIDEKDLKVIVELTENCDKIGVKALRIIGNLVITTNDLHSELIKNGLFSILEGFFRFGGFDGQKEALMILSNFCVGIKENLCILLSHDVIKVALEFLLSDNDELKSEAVWISRNLCKHEKFRDMLSFLGHNEVLISLLETEKELILHPLLEFLYICLEFEDFSSLFKKLEGKSLLVSHLTSSSIVTRTRCLILANHFFSNDTL